MTKSKILAAVAVLAMALCVMVVAPADADAAVAQTDVAQIDDTGYATLEAALAAAVSEDEVTLLKDVTITTAITVKEGVTLTIDNTKLTIGQGGTLNVKGTIGSEDIDSNVIIRGNGQVNVYTTATIDNIVASTIFTSAEDTDLVAIVADDERWSYQMFMVEILKDATVPKGFSVPAELVLMIGEGVEVYAEALTNNGTIMNAGVFLKSSENGADKTVITNNGTFVTLIDEDVGFGDRIADFAPYGINSGAVGEIILESGFWTYAYDTDSSTDGNQSALLLSDYVGSQRFEFSNTVEITLDGTSVIDRSSLDGSNNDACIDAGGAMTIIGDGSLTVYASDGVNQYGIHATGKITIGEPVTGEGADATPAVKTKITATSGYQAIRGNAGIDVYNAEVTASAEEKALRTNGGQTIRLYAGADVTAKLIEPGEVNQVGADDRYGVKTGTLTIENGAELVSDGVYVDTEASVNGILNVKYNSLAGREADLETTTAAEKKVSALPAGLVAAGYDKDTNKKNPTSMKIVTIGDTGTINVEVGNAIFGKIKNGNNEVTFGSFGVPTSNNEYYNYVLKAIVAESDLLLKAGSVVIKGEVGAWEQTDAGITITGAVEISGVSDVPITVGSGATVTVPAGETLTLNKDMSVADGSAGGSADTFTTINILGDLDGNAYIVPAGDDYTRVTATNPTVIQQMINPTDNSVKVKVEAPAIAAYLNSNIDTQDELDSLFKNNNIVIVNGADYVLGFDVTIPAGVTLYLNGYKLSVGDTNFTNPEVTLTIDGGKVKTGIPNIDYTSMGILTLGSGTSEGIVVNDNLLLDAADVCADVAYGVDVNGDAVGYISVSNPIVSEISKSTPNSFDVGYGNTIVLTDSAIPAGMVINVYGTLELNGKVSVAYGSILNISKSGEVDVIGQFDVAGTMTNLGTVKVPGTMNVANDNGGALLETGGLVEIDGTFNLTKPKAGNAAKTNSLVITGVAQHSVSGFFVNGTMNVTGVLTGAIQDLGTITFNGTVSGAASIVLHDGISLTVQSVIGPLTVTDEGYCYESVYGLKDFATSDGNQVVLTNVKGVTVSTVSTSKTVTVTSATAGDVKYRVEYADMTVTGTVSAAVKGGTGSVEVTGANSTHIVSGTDSAITSSSKFTKGSITVSDVTLGEGITLEFAGKKMYAAGEINAISKYSVVKVTGTDSVTVTGTITIGPDANYIKGVTTDTPVEIPALFNGSRYDVTDETDGDVTVYITTLEDAVAKIADADDDTVLMLGKVTVKGDIVIPAGAELILNSGAELKIQGTMTVEATGTITASSATVVVEGVLTINDKASGLTPNNADGKFKYQVYTENGDVATYTGIIGAMANAKEGDIITLRQSTEIDEDLVIPAGVTLVVPANVILTLDNAEGNVKLTVNGTLKVEKKGAVDASTAFAATAKDKRADIVINGVYAYAGNDVTNEPAKDNYATFQKKVEGALTTFYSNLTYAAMNCDDGTITIQGDVSAGDITLAAADGKDVTLVVPADASVSASSITLVGDATIDTIDIPVAPEVAGALTADIIVDATDGRIVVSTEKLSGVDMVVNIESGADGDVITLSVNGALKGAMTVEEGTVDVIGALTVGATESDILTVASGAAVHIEKTGSVYIDGMVPTSPSIEECAGLVIDGTVLVDGDLLVSEIVDVNGTLEVSKDGDVMIPVVGVMNVLGTVDIDEECDGFTVNGKLYVGEGADTLAATATVSGPVTLAGTGYTVVFTGGDVSGAKINVNPATGESTAKSTTYVIDGADYMTVYAKDSSSVDAKFIITMKGFDEITVWNKDADCKEPITPGTKVGVYKTLYAEAEPSTVYGTISEGTGITIYIDDKTICNLPNEPEGYGLTVGTHTISYDVYSGYDGKDVVVLVNGVPVANGGSFEISADATEFEISATGAVPAPSVIVPSEKTDDGMSLTEILLIVLVVLILIMAIIVAMRLMRN